MFLKSIDDEKIEWKVKEQHQFKYNIASAVRHKPECIMGVKWSLYGTEHINV